MWALSNGHTVSCFVDTCRKMQTNGYFNVVCVQYFTPGPSQYVVARQMQPTTWHPLHGDVKNNYSYENLGGRTVGRVVRVGAATERYVNYTTSPATEVHLRQSIEPLLLPPPIIQGLKTCFPVYVNNCNPFLTKRRHLLPCLPAEPLFA